jgi:cell wall-associated NlpC family hydrolase
VGIPYNNGPVYEEGKLNCYEIVMSVYREHKGVDLPDFRGMYSDPANAGEVSAAIVGGLDGWDEVEEPSSLDVIVFRIMGMPWHCGVYLEAGKFLHSMKGHNAAIDRLSSLRWRDRVEGFYQCKS